MDPQQFNAVLLDISNRMSSDELDKLKFLVSDRVGKRDLERITTGHGLFEVLTQRRLLAPDITDYLSELLNQIHRPDLSDRLNGEQPDDVPDPETVKLNIAAEVVAANLSRNWRKLGRRLQVSDVKLESISRKHPTDLEETTLELLKEWRRSQGAEARTEELIRALRDCQLNLTADRVEDELKNAGYQ
ncbi:protein FADD [Kryptolebias marmoratus]|uniref:Fas (tnfrsf6)-associated via death domain n=1 Tax=Kryptolebias marmoratus TaxID=37003 RepID=A0A3Q3FXB5_KRYMA|nr:protein FADD [Kryptolebias marmoratus]